MRAGHKGGGRYTERGPGAQPDKSHIPMVIELPADRIADVSERDSALPVVPEKVCPHGGIYIDNIPRCGECFQKRGGTPEESWNLFLMSLYDVCRRIAWKHKDWEKSIPFGDRVHHTFVTLFSPDNMLRLMKARDPLALAHKIAERRMIDLQRKPVYWKEWKVSQLNSFDVDKGTDDRRSDFSEECYENVRCFPGVKLFWDDTNLNKIRVALRDIESRLPTYPFSVSLAIKLHIGYWPETGKYSFEEVAAWASEQNGNGKTITAKQARYAIEKALEQMKLELQRLFIPVLKK